MKKTLVVLLMLTVFTSMALAQGGRGGQRGQRGGGNVLTRPDVQKELKLTSSQNTKIATAIEDNRPEFGGGRGAGGGGGGGGGQRGSGGGGRGFGMTRPVNVKLEAAFKGILNDTQFKRYNELALQQLGGFALPREDIAKKLKLTDAQKEELTEISQDMGEDMRDMFSGGGGGGNVREEITALRADYGKQMVKVLTAAQTKTWKEMLGKAFKFQQIER